MSTGEIENKVPEETKAAIALLKKGMLSKGMIMLVLRGVIYIVIAAFVLGKWTVRIDLFETNITDKMNTMIKNQEADRAEIKSIHADVSGVIDRVSFIEGRIGVKNKPK